MNLCEISVLTAEREASSQGEETLGALSQPQSNNGGD